MVSGSGFPVSATWFTNVIAAASFAQTGIVVAAGATTANPAVLSSNVINAVTGAYTGTVSLPAITTGSAFTLTDAFGNVATQTLTTGTATVNLSPATGKVGTVVTATLTGFGPGATITNVDVGNLAVKSAAAFAPAATVTEQGTAVVVFTMPAGTPATKAGVAGAQTITVTDSKGNVGTATFTITPEVALELGNTASGSSGTTYVPASTSSKLFINAAGFKANTEITITGSPNIPNAWIVPTAAWTVTTGTYSAITGKISTDANGAVVAVSILGNSPAAAGQYSVTISDGTNSISTILTVTTSGNIVAVDVDSGARGSAVTAIYFGATPASIFFDGTLVAAPAPASHQAWPLVTTNTQVFNVPNGASAGLHTVSAGVTFNSVGYTVESTSVKVVSPASASVGTTVTIVGSGYASATPLIAIQGATVVPVTNNLVDTTLIATFVIPNYIPGSYPLSLSDVVGIVTVNTASSTLNVAQPSIAISPTTSTLGTVKIAITGSGFAAGEAITVNFDGVAIAAAPATGLTVFNTNGGILLLSGYAIPVSATAGTHTVSVLGTTGAYAQATFTVTPSLTPLAAVRPGAKVTITGTGFAANSLQSLTVGGTATAWLNTATNPASAINQAIVVTTATGDLYGVTTVGFVVPTTQEPGTLTVTVTDAQGNTASTNLVVLGTPAITPGASNIVAGNIATSITLSGTGFTPGAPRTFKAELWNGATFVANVQLNGAATANINVGNNGAFTTLAGLTFELPAGTVAGPYTLRVATTTAPIETADAAITVMGAPTADVPATVKSGSKVDITVTGLSAITDATINTAVVTNLVTGSVVQTVAGANQFGAIVVPSAGASAFTLSTWFIVPTNTFAGTYILTLTDANTGLNVQKAITIQPSITIAPTTGIKGALIEITGTGFAANPATVTATFNGAPITLSTNVITAAGGITPTFNVPVTAQATNTLVVTDSAGNTASATFTLAVPTLTLNPASAAPGSTVQLLGSGFTAASTIFIHVNGQIVTTVPANIATVGGAFIAYVTLPSGLSGEVPVTATDAANNVATATLTVSGASGTGTPSQTTMSSTAQTTTASGTAATTFAAGSTVKAGFMLQSTSGSRDVVVAVTWQQGAKVYNMASFQTTMTTTASAVSFSNLVPAGVTGTWTATLQVFAADGVTPLGVTTLTFTVS